MERCFLYFVIFFVFISCCISYAQDKKIIAESYARSGIEEVDRGNFTKGIRFLEQAEECDPDNITYPYEIALAYALDKDYGEAIEILEKLTKHKDVMDLVYSLLGSCYDYDGDPQKAIETYDKGLKLFPNSGPLHLERGMMENMKKNYKKALEYYEEGIKVAPMYPSNYFRAAIIHIDYGNKVLGMFYAEIFMNLEKETKRTLAMGSLLFSAYKSSLKYDADSNKINIYIRTSSLDFQTDSIYGILPGFLYYLMLSQQISGEPVINIESLNRIRTKHVTDYFKSGFNMEYYNVLYDWQNYLISEKKFEAYNYWLFQAADFDEFKKWYDTHKQQYDDFEKWFKDNDIDINGKTKTLFMRLKKED